MSTQGQGGERPPYKETAYSSRFGDTKLAFAMKLYEHKEGDALWVFSVREYCGGEDLIKIVATEKALLDARHFIDRALENVRSCAPPTSNGGDHG